MEQSKKPTKDIPSKEDLKKKKKEDEEKKSLSELLEKLNFKEESDKTYSFSIELGRFVFRIPNLMEKTKISAIHSQIAFIDGENFYSSTDEIMSSGDLSLMCLSKVLTHTKILMEECPKNFDIEKCDDIEQFNLGYAIFWCEIEFLNRKKKAS